jgi:hypothetical protein
MAKAKEIAEDWYLKLRGKLRSGEVKSEETFREVSAHLLARVRHHDAGATQPAICRRREPRNWR